MIKNFLILSLLTALVSIIQSQNSFTYNACSQTQILNIKTLLCEQCPINTRPSPNQNIPTSCVCQKGYIPILGTFQCQLAISEVCGQTTYANIFDKNGQQISNGNTTCDACADNAFSNQNGTGCVSCPTGMTYSVGQGCICSDPTDTKTLRGCYPKSLTSALNLGQSNSDYYEQLKYLLPGCYTFQDLLSCSYMVNLCTYSHLSDTPECNFFNNLDTYAPYMFPSDTNFYMGPGTFTKDSALSLKLMLFLPTGNYVGQKQLKLPDIIRCGMPSDNSASLIIGNNIEITCTFNFLYLVQKMGTHTYQNYLYELFIADSSNQFSQVPVYINSNTQAAKRFYLQNTYSSDKTISVLTSLQFSIQMNTTGYLVDPKLEVSYTTLSVQNGLITPEASKYQEIVYSVNFTYDLTNFWTGAIIIFIIVNVLVLIQSIIRSYIAYLNRESPLAFFFYFAKFWSLWMFYFLFSFSGYWFITTKTTQQPYVFVPSSQSQFYPIFYALSALMIFLRVLTVLLQKNQKLNYEVFLINWQKGHFKNSWRQIFIINSLAQFYTYRTVSTFYMLLCMMFFLVGLEWQENAAEVTNTDLTTIYSFSPLNRIFLYFVSCGVFLAVGVIFKILRRISVIQWPLPFEDFVDYCNVTNISFFFLKKKSSQAFYIHAAIQDRVEVTYKEINEAIRRGLNKNRGIAKEMSFHDHQRMYSVYISKDLEDKYNAMLRKEDEDKDQSHNISKNVMNNSKARGKHILSPREDFVEKKLKPHLQIISRQGSNRTKTFAQMNLGYPPIDLRDPNSTLKTKSQVLFDENLELIKEVFPNGDQFQQIHTIIIIFLAFILLTGNVSITAFITYFIDSYILNGWISHKCRKNLERMTKVKEGFML